MKDSCIDTGDFECFLKEIVDTCFEDSFAHGRQHVLRVVSWVKQLAFELQEDGEIVDDQVLIAAAYLHDLGRLKDMKPRVDKIPPPDFPHAERSVIFAKEILSNREDFSWDKIEKVENAILAHSFSLGVDASTLESKILSDADKLDAMGAQGILRTLAWSIEKGRSFPDMVRHFNEKILVLKDRLHTEPAKKIAGEKQELLEAFIKDLIDSGIS